MSWVTIRDAVKARLDTISGLASYDVVPDTSPSGDVAMVLPDEPLIVPSAARGKLDVSFIVLVRCKRATGRDAQEALDSYLWPTGTKSIVAAIEDEDTLSGNADATQFVGVGAPHVPGVGEGGQPVQGVYQAEVHFRAKCNA